MVIGQTYPEEWRTFRSSSADSIQSYSSASSGSAGGSSVGTLIAFIPSLIVFLIGVLFTMWGSGMWGTIIIIFSFFMWALISSAIKVNNEWEEAIILRFGKFKKTVGAGLFFKWPIIESVIRRDRRIRTLDIPKQQVITRDNISVGIDAVVFLKVMDTRKTIVEIQDFVYSVKQYAQTTLRNVIGQKDLDELLSKREQIAQEIKKVVDEVTDKWGVDIISVELQDIALPEDMKRVMARQAEAEREKRGVIIASEGELEAAQNLREASDELAKSKYSYALRQLQTISDVSQDQSNTIIFAPSEALNSPVLSSGISSKVPKPKSSSEKK